MKKGLISLMLAGAMVGAVGTMAACDEKEIDYEITQITTSERLSATNLIVAVYNKKVELHRADIYSLYHSYVSAGNFGYAYHFNDKIDYKCGKQNDYTQMYHGYENMPDKSEYDVLCEDCFADYIIK